MNTLAKRSIFAISVLVLSLAFLLWPSRSTTAEPQAPVSNFEIVHFVETKGRITNTQNAFDTTMYVHYAGRSTLNIEITLYDEATGLQVPGPCGDRPCTFTFGGGARNRQVIRFEDMIDFSTKTTVLGTAFITLRGDDPATFLADIYLVNSRQNAFDLSYVLLPLHPLPAGFRR